MSTIVDEDPWPPKQGSSPFVKKATQIHGKRYNNESDLSSEITKKLNSITNVRCQKIKASVYGEPTLDIVGSKTGQFFWLEVKQPGKKPTKRQYSTMKDYIDNGAIATWTDSVKGAISFIKEDWSFLTKEKMLEGFHAD